MHELSIQIGISFGLLVLFITFMTDKILQAIGAVAKRLPPEAK
jgi:hypothetical protein